MDTERARMTEAAPRSIRGRGAAGNPPTRFDRVWTERDPDWNDADDPAPRTQFFQDATVSIIAYNDSPDVGFSASVNPYRGCEHGCAYCYARPFHEYLGFSAGLDFETKIMVKMDAPTLLRRELASPKWRPQTLALSGVTDPYQPVERRLQLTRKCLEVLAEFRNPVAIVTKNHLITRDLDLLQSLAKVQAVTVSLSVTTLDPDLARRLEPRTSSPRQRLDAIRALADAGIPVGVLVAPIIPGLTDHEMPAILQAAAEAGARWGGKEVLRLPLTVAPVFEEWLSRNEPARKEKVLNQIRSLRRGKLNDPRFGTRMRGEGVFAEQLSRLFHLTCRKLRLAREGQDLSTASFRRPAGTQLCLFDR